MLKRHYHYGVTSAPNYNPKRVPEIIEAAHQRLMNVQIESLPYEQVLEKYDRDTTFFYIDPPYYARKLYNFNLTNEDFQKPAENLKQLKGKFLLSLNDHPEVGRIFEGFQIRSVQLAYTAKQNTSAKYQELLIANYDLNQLAKTSSDNGHLRQYRAGNEPLRNGRPQTSLTRANPTGTRSVPTQNQPAMPNRK